MHACPQPCSVHDLEDERSCKKHTRRTTGVHAIRVMSRCASAFVTCKQGSMARMQVVVGLLLHTVTGTVTDPCSARFAKLDPKCNINQSTYSAVPSPSGRCLLAQEEHEAVSSQAMGPTLAETDSAVLSSIRAYGIDPVRFSWVACKNVTTSLIHTTFLGMINHAPAQLPAASPLNYTILGCKLFTELQTRCLASEHVTARRQFLYPLCALHHAACTTCASPASK